MPTDDLGAPHRHFTHHKAGSLGSPSRSKGDARKRKAWDRLRLALEAQQLTSVPGVKISPELARLDALFIHMIGKDPG